MNIRDIRDTTNILWTIRDTTNIQCVIYCILDLSWTLEILLTTMIKLTYYKSSGIPWDIRYIRFIIVNGNINILTLAWTIRDIKNIRYNIINNGILSITRYYELLYILFNNAIVNTLWIL